MVNDMAGQTQTKRDMPANHEQDLVTANAQGRGSGQAAGEHKGPSSGHDFGFQAFAHSPGNGKQKRDDSVQGKTFSGPAWFQHGNVS
jgi:hypothetical protein